MPDALSARHADTAVIVADAGLRTPFRESRFPLGVSSRDGIVSGDDDCATMAPLTGSLLAHQGGWDEIAMVAVPVLAFAAMLRLARKRASQRQAEPAGQAQPGSDPA